MLFTVEYYESLRNPGLWATASASTTSTIAAMAAVPFLKSTSNVYANVHFANATTATPASQVDYVTIAPTVPKPPQNTTDATADADAPASAMFTTSSGPRSVKPKINGFITVLLSPESMSEMEYLFDKHDRLSRKDFLALYLQRITGQSPRLRNLVAEMEAQGRSFDVFPEVVEEENKTSSADDGPEVQGKGGKGKECNVVA
ncbi:hypothetical protein SCUCBS95973_007291 [Sporothrix curviconia]|uniref:Uncharacterized protein n=1 Tax=Sporothrix curviconia TaxID=1260050 RepID=A0ABP0CCA0_9PEZI